MTSCRLQSNYSSTAARRASSVTSRCGLSWVTRRYKLVPILVQRPACGVCVRVVRLVYIWTVWSRRWRNSARGRWRLGSCGWLPICSWLQALTGNVDRSERLLRQSTESTVVTQFTHFVCSCQAVCLPSVLTAINFTWYQTLTLFSHLYQRPSVSLRQQKLWSLEICWTPASRPVPWRRIFVEQFVRNVQLSWTLLSLHLSAQFCRFCWTRATAIVCRWQC